VDHVDLADHVGVEVVQLLGRNPELEDRLPARLLDGIPAQELRLDLETSDESGATVLTFQSRAILIA
jgi:hypothetical protein